VEIGAVEKEIDVEREGIGKVVDVGEECGRKNRYRKKRIWEGSRY
jgi:hypothetical protein